MNSVRLLHDEAMAIAEKAFSAKLMGDLDAWASLSRGALEKERAAAELLADDLSAEPSRSVLYRSAASLAIDCRELRLAEKLLAKALAGNPPYEIADELRDLLDVVNLNRHLELRGIMLESNELQLSLAGRVVGYRTILLEEFKDRIEKCQRLLYRTLQRKMGRPFRDRLHLARFFADGYGLFLSPGRGGSFSVTLRLARPAQLQLPGFDYARQVLDELLDDLELVNEAQHSELRKRIPEDSYHRNFIALTRGLAPDGEQVHLVGFTIVREQQERSVALTRRRDHMPPIPAPPEAQLWPTPGEPCEIEGELLYANSKRAEKQQIQLIDNKGKARRIFVPKGLMSDIVKPLWEDKVRVIGVKVRGGILLQDIQRCEDDTAAQADLASG